MPLLWRKDAHRRVQGVEAMAMPRMFCGTSVFSSSREYFNILLHRSCAAAFIFGGSERLASCYSRNSNRIYISVSICCTT